MHATRKRNFAGGAALLPCFVVMVRQTKTTLCSPLTVRHIKLRRHGRCTSWQVKTNGTER